MPQLRTTEGAKDDVLIQSLEMPVKEQGCLPPALSFLGDGKTLRDDAFLGLETASPPEGITASKEYIFS